MAALLKRRKHGFHIGGRIHGGAGLDQTGLLPEGLEGSVVEEQDGNGYD
jgi:hypothetical protein